MLNLVGYQKYDSFDNGRLFNDNVSISSIVAHKVPLIEKNEDLDKV